MPATSPEAVFSFLKRAHGLFQGLSTQFEFDRHNPQQRNVVALYGSILELTDGLILLLDKQLLTGVPVLLRSVLEAYVDLHNLAENSAYGYALELSYIKEWLKILKEAKEGKNEYLSEITKAPSLNDSISSWQQKKQELEADRYRSLKIEQKFKRAGMEKEYRSIYNALCSDAHNNLRALMDRHFELSQDSLEVVFYKAFTIEDCEIYLGMASELLVRGSQEIHQFLNSTVQEEVAEIRAELNQLRGE